MLLKVRRFGLQACFFSLKSSSLKYCYVLSDFGKFLSCTVFLKYVCFILISDNVRHELYLYFISVSVYFFFYHKLTLALIWIAEIEKRKMTKIWPGHFMVWWCSLYSLSQWYCLFCYFQSVIFWALLWKTKLRSPHQIQPAWTVCEFVCLCVRVCFIRASINSNFFLVCLLFF